MAAITGTSSSCMGLISTLKNSASSLTLATGAHLTRKFKILPSLALVQRRAQEIPGMVGDNQGYARNAEAVHLLAQTPERLVGSKQILRGDPSYRQHDFRLQQRNLPLQVGQTLGGLAGVGIAIAGGTALQDIRNVDLLALQSHGAQHGIEQLTGP